MDNVFTIREYLNAHCNVMSVDDIVLHFIEKFGVHVSNENDLFLFKYNQISANWNEAITYECRGVILRRIIDKWEYVSIPFKKFFNIGEGKCAFSNEDYFKAHVNELSYVEKVDGSCIQVWYDDVSGNWRASTLGSISTASVFDHPFTFSDLFWKVFGADRSRLIKGNTYIFELWTKYNQVVTEYNADMVVLLGIRNNTNFSLNDIDINVESEKLSVKTPYRFSQVINTHAELQEWIEEISLREDLFGRTPEGVVGIFNNIPVFKGKNIKYCQYHKLITGDKTYVLKNIIATVFHGNIDDIYPDINEELKSFVDRLVVEINRIRADVLKSIKEFSDIGIHDRKAFALRLKNLASLYESCGTYSAFYFDKRELILRGEYVDIVEWLVENDRYSKHIDRWKAV